MITIELSVSTLIDLGIAGGSVLFVRTEEFNRFLDSVSDVQDKDGVIDDDTMIIKIPIGKHSVITLVRKDD